MSTQLSPEESAFQQFWKFWETSGDENLSWDHFKRLHVTRGLTPAEHRILSYLVDDAGPDGTIDPVFVRTLAIRCEMSRASWHKHIASLETKAFIERMANAGALKQQIANTYKLDTTRLFPKDPNNPGQRLWAELAIQGTGRGAPLLISPTKEHLEGSLAWYDAGNRVLYVWFDARRDSEYFFRHRRDLKAAGKVCSPEVRFFDFLAIPNSGRTL